MLSDLVYARLDGERPLTDLEIVSVLLQLLVAGNETTTNLLAAWLQFPERFRVDRPNAKEHLGFGIGVHYRPGPHWPAKRRESGSGSFWIGYPVCAWGRGTTSPTTRACCCEG
jgi:cytochrome P450